MNKLIAQHDWRSHVDLIGYLKCATCGMIRRHNDNETECDGPLRNGAFGKLGATSPFYQPAAVDIPIPVPDEVTEFFGKMESITAETEKLRSMLKPAQSEVTELFTKTWTEIFGEFGVMLKAGIAQTSMDNQPSSDNWFERTQPIHMKTESDNRTNVPGYELLIGVLHRAYDQAAKGKGHERHSNGEPFDEQVMADMARRFGVGALLAQAFKKSEESQRLPHDAAIRELLGAINYLAGAVIHMEKHPKNKKAEG